MSTRKPGGVEGGREAEWPSGRVWTAVKTRSSLLVASLLSNSARSAHHSWVSPERAFLTLPPDQRSREKPPHKHKVPAGFHRGLELFGQQASRFPEPGYREVLARCGPIIVEGFNDVLALDQLGNPAVEIMSNKITAEQVDKIERWARQLAQGRVSLLFDADGPGCQGAKETLWLLTERNLVVRIGWSRSLNITDRQPEHLTREEWENEICPRLWRD